MTALTGEPQYKAEKTGGWTWDEAAADFVRWEGIVIRWRFTGERRWRKINVIPDAEKGQTAESLLEQADAITAALAAKAERSPHA